MYGIDISRAEVLNVEKEVFQGLHDATMIFQT